MPDSTEFSSRGSSDFADRDQVEILIEDLERPEWMRECTVLVNGAEIRGRAHVTIEEEYEEVLGGYEILGRVNTRMEVTLVLKDVSVAIASTAEGLSDG